jgi:nicotinamidase-related amidase
MMKSALIVIDVQRDVVANAFRRDEVVANISGLVDRARKDGVPVIWVQHSDDELVKGSEGWAYVDELRMADDEPVVHKQLETHSREQNWTCYYRNAELSV